MKILLAEDDPHIRAALVHLLSGEGYQVAACADGEEALRRFPEFHPDLALLDVMMPRFSGFEVCRRLRQQRPALPILFLSAKSEEADRVTGLDLGADDFISKPFSGAELKARLRAWLRRLAPPQDGGGFAFGPWTVLPDQLAARQAARQVELSLLDLKVLKYFSLQRGRCLSRGQLLEECWGLAADTPTRTVDTKIAQLRKLLEEDPAEPRLIQTQHGLGYLHPAI